MQDHYIIEKRFTEDPEQSELYAQMHDLCKAREFAPSKTYVYMCTRLIGI